MNEVIQALEQRRSIRKYKTDMIPATEMDQIIEAGLYAANGMCKQATKIIAVTNKEVRDKLADMNRKFGGWKEGFDPFYGAPVVLIVLGKKDWENCVYDGSCVLENMMVAAHSLGIGSCWIHRAKEAFETEYGKDLLAKLGIEGEWEGIGHCVLGYPDYPEGQAPKAAPRKPDRVYYVE